MVKLRKDGKPIDSPLSLHQYEEFLRFFTDANKHYRPPIHVERVPEWVLSSIEAAEKRDADYERLRFEPNIQSQSDEELLYFKDSARLAGFGTERAKRVLPYQIEGANFGLKRGGRCLIADEMGLGKTLQALIVAYQYKAEWPLLIVCPSSIRFVWRDQISRWLGGLIDPRKDVQVITKGKDAVRGDAKIVIAPYVLLEPNPHLSMRPGATKLPYNVVICDESHYIKDPSSKRSKAAQKILKKAKRIVLLSGTPSMNNAEEMYAQMVHLLPIAKKPTLTEFRERYCVMSQFMMRGYPVVRYSGARHREELNALLVKSVMIRRMKSEVLTQLPEKLRHRVELDIENSHFAKKVQDLTSRWLSNSSMSSIEVQLGSLGRGSPSSDWGIQTMELWRLTSQAKLGSVKEYLADLLGGSSDQKLILFAHHKFMLEGLEEMLSKSLGPGAYIRIDGSVDSNKRGVLVDQFQHDTSCRVALLSITSCAEGITLTAASVVIFTEMYWVPGLIEQAEARAHRVGQKDCVFCYYLVMPNSPDDVIFNMLEKKKKDTSAILDGSETGLIADRPKALQPVHEDITDAELLDIIACIEEDERRWTEPPSQVGLHVGSGHDNPSTSYSDPSSKRFKL